MDDTAAAFCQANWPGLVRLLTVRIGDPEAGQDLAQEVLARVVARWNRIGVMKEPVAYAYRIGLNLVHDHHRRQRGSLRPETEQPRTVDDPAVRVVEIDAVRQALVSLSRRQRHAVLLRYVADLTVSECARVMRCREGTVRALCHQATTRLRQHPLLNSSGVG